MVQVMNLKWQIWQFNELQIFVTLVFFNKTLKPQLGVYTCYHTNKLKLTTKQTIPNLKYLISCVLKARTPRLTFRFTVSQYVDQVLVNITIG